VIGCDTIKTSFSMEEPLQEWFIARGNPAHEREGEKR
jgi:hypothetical protein